MSTKKSGKEVLKSKKEAENSIRARKGLQPKKTPIKKKSRDEISDDSEGFDSGDSMKDFVVDSDADEEEMEESEEMESEEEEEEEPKLNNNDSDSDSDGNSNVDSNVDSNSNSNSNASTPQKRPPTSLSPPPSSPIINKKRSKHFPTPKPSSLVDLSSDSPSDFIDLTSDTPPVSKKEILDLTNPRNSTGNAWVKKTKSKKSVLTKKQKDELNNQEFDEDGFAILQKSDSEQDEDDMSSEESDSGEDKNLREAETVLQSVKNLSNEIVLKCSEWTSSSKTVSDGALSLLFGSGSTWIKANDITKYCNNLKLADYQVVGVNWLIMLSRLEFRGGGVNGILGDEMGLGKTVQTIAFLSWFRENGGLADNSKNSTKTSKKSKILEDSDDEETSTQVKKRQNLKPHLIVVPASVLDNWERELEKFAPDFVVVKYHGSLDERRELQWLLKKSSAFSSDNVERLDVVLTSFSYFSSEKADDRNFLRKLNFTYMIIDEAHCLKNPTGARYKNLDRFKTERRILLTGTPVQNNPKELMSLLCFLMPFFKQPKSKGWSDEQGGNDGGARILNYFVELSKVQSGEEEGKKKAYAKLKNLMAPFVLRRKKEIALKQMLPSKTSKLELVPFCPSSKTLYNSILTDHAAHLSGEKKMKENEAKNVFFNLRKAANNPLLLRTRWKEEEDVKYLIKWTMANNYFGTDHSLTDDLVRSQLASMSDFLIHSMCLDIIQDNNSMKDKLERFTLMETDMFVSPKLERLRTMLPKLVKEGHRVLLFSQWTMCMDILECLLNSLGMKFFRLDGSTDIKERQDMIDEFNEDESISVFLLSTRAGGMGINLTAADTVIIHDLDFNPTVDLQAEDRCHRIGQTRPVTVYKLVTEGSVDEKIYEMQERKKLMIGDVLNEGQGNQSNAKKKKEEVQDISMLVAQALNKFIEEKGQTPVKEKEKKGGDILEEIASPEL